MFRKLLVGIVAMTFALTCYGQITTQQLKGFNDLSETDKAEIVRQIEEKTKPADKTDKTLEKAERWVNLGSQIGKSLGGAAKELGIAVNEFADTPVGKLTAALVVWKIMGNSLLHIVGGFMFFTTMLPLWFYIYRRYCVVSSITETVHPNNPNKTLKTIAYRDSDDTTGNVLFMLFVLLVLIGIGSVITFASF